MLDSAVYVILATPNNPRFRFASLWTESIGLHSSEGAIALFHLHFPIWNSTSIKFSEAEPSVREKNRQDACATKIFCYCGTTGKMPVQYFLENSPLKNYKFMKNCIKIRNRIYNSTLNYTCLKKPIANG